MSEAVPSPQDCCETCPEPSTTSVPGATGAAGAAGASGTNGINAFTTLTAQVVMPAEGATVVANVASNEMFSIGQKVFLGDPAGAARGTFEVTVKTGTTQLTLLNVEDTATNAYLDNSPAGTIFPALTQVSPSGLQGPSMSAAGGALLAVNNLNDVANAGTSRTNLGLGTAAVATNGVAPGNLPPVGAVALVAAESVWVNALGTGLITKAQAPALAALGVILGNANLNVPTVDQVAGLVAGEVVFATAAGLETVTAAAARTALGVGAGLAFKGNKNGVPAAIAATRVTFVEQFDPDSVYVDASDRYIPGIVGAVVQIHCQANFSTALASTLTLWIYKNGVAIAETYATVAGATTVPLSLNVSDLVAGAGDFYEVFAGSSALGSSIDGDITKTWFEGHRIG